MNSLVAAKIDSLRKRLLDPSRRNKLINLSITPKNLNYLRVIDEFPDDVLAKLMGSQMTIAALPELESERSDEVTQKFIEALILKRLSDEDYLELTELLTDNDPSFDDKFLAAENKLKDKVRIDLGLLPIKRDSSVTLSEHALSHGIRPSYELPQINEKNDDGRHEDYEIQTLLLPERLDKVSKSIKERARSFVLETGINVFQVSFGILEWSPAGEATPYRSPICLLEADISIDPGYKRKVKVSGRGEPVINTSLAHKLYSEHRIELPEFAGVSVEEYLSELSENAPSGWKWSVKRQIVLGIFPSAKMAMYNDLDPETSEVTDNSLLEKLLTSTGDSENVYADNYDIDGPEMSKTVPFTVMDADSSQYSALIDAANGKNMSIEGPPGSGKSQTIVNIIADAIRNNKKVLFVAEKLTALEVVRNRLESVNLSHLVLSLQHTKKAKEGIYDNIRERVELTSDQSSQDDHLRMRDRLNLLAQKKDKLNQYSALIGSNYNETGKTIHEVIGEFIASSANLINVPFHLQKTKVKYFETLNELELAELSRLCDELDDKKDKLVNAPKLWIDATASILNRNDVDNLCALANEFIRQMKDAQERLQNTPTLAAISELTDPEKLSNISNELSKIDHNEQSTRAYLEYSKSKLSLAEANQNIKNLIKEVSITQNNFKNKYLTEDRAELERDLIKAISLLTDLDPDYKIQNTKTLISGLNETVKNLTPILDAINNSTASTRFWDGLEVGQAIYEIRKLEPFIERYKFLPEIELSDYSLSFTDEYIKEIREIRADLTRIQRTFSSVSIDRIDYPAQKIRQISATIQSASFFTKFSQVYKEAMSYCHSILGVQKRTPITHIVQTLTELENAIDRAARLEDNFKYAEHLGKLASGLGTDLIKLNEFKSAQKALVNSIFYKKGKIEDLYDVDLSCFKIDLPNVLEGQMLSDLERVAKRASNDLDSQKANLAKVQEALKFCKPNETIEFISLKSLSGDLRKLQQEGIEAQELVGNNQLILDVIFHDQHRPILAQLVEIISACLAEISSHSGADSLIKNLLFTDPLSYKNDLTYIDAKFISVKNNSKNFFNEIGLDLPSDKTIFENLLERLDDIKHALKHPEILIVSSRAREVVNELKKYDLEDVVSWYSANPNLPIKFKDVVSAIIAKNRTDEIFKQHSDILNKSDGDTLNRLRKEFASEDKQIMALAKYATSKENLTKADPPIGKSTGYRSEYTDMSLIRHELNKSRRISVRDLTRRAFGALIELHPCWMMSPLAVSQYLPREELFDLVIIDEASQLTPENAIGALIRSKQAIVVGDTKQLPPTSFFQNSTEDQEEDDDIREDSESILDLANMVFTPIRQLRWHYRSKDASLIQFSNEWLYNNQLTIFPSANDQDPNFGVELVEVEGEYKGRVNVAEAQEVVRRTLEHAKKFPDRSLGIATMNSDQKALIEQELDLAQNNNRNFQEFINYWEEKDGGLERLFIKNLETVQGDERDVIFISTLYGPEKKNGKVYQRFGPINSKVGHRRLNVLFTRSKEKMVTFTSLKPNDVMAHANSNKGVQMFKAWLEYCKTGHISAPQTGGGTDSPFEDYVIKQIEALGCTAVPQVGAGGFRIDIGVKHPEYPYGYLLAVECDGATYHSSYSARDRDRLRQEILEGLGWSFHRIWSTDWFNDQPGEIEKLKKAIEVELGVKKSKYSKMATKSSPIIKEQSTRQNTQVQPKQSTLFTQERAKTKYVKQGSTVTVKFVSDEKIKKIRLLDQSMAINGELSDWIINIKTPMGQKLIDAEVEDIISLPIEGINKQAEIIKIE